MSAKTAEKAENHSKEGPINTTVGKSLGNPLFTIPCLQLARQLCIQGSMPDIG